jgi:hypothetical protein
MSSEHDGTTHSGKKSYQKPSLTAYGRVKDLTTGGTGSANEPSSGKKPRP